MSLDSSIMLGKSGLRVSPFCLGTMTLINGQRGAMVQQIGLADSRMAQIGRAIRWIRGHHAEAIRIEELARIAGMSVTSSTGISEESRQ
jgi:aryl-alcohol dehydrogenase-like predicted oxidoreductase